MEFSNPFTPGFGHSPAILAGREAALSDFDDALAGDLPEQRALLIAGARGIGKTVLLAEFEARAADAGWTRLVLHTASSSLIDELRSQAVARLRDLDPEATTSRLTGAAASGFSATRQVIDRYGDPEPIGDVLERLAHLTSAQGTGVMIALDEVQSVDRGQLHAVSQHVQDMIRHSGNVVFVAAGVRTGVDALLEHEKTTFLRRAHRLDLGRVDVGTAAEAIRMTVADTPKTITPEATVRAGEVSQGYPYLIQLVGSKAWRNTGDASTIEVEDVQQAAPSVVTEMMRNVHGPALRDLSAKKQDYLRAMLEDEGRPSNVGDIARRLGIDPREQSTYRERLIRDELIEPAGRGYVQYALPYLREALEDRQQGGTRTLPDQGLTRSRARTTGPGTGPAEGRAATHTQPRDRGYGR